MDAIVTTLAAELRQPEHYVNNVVALLDEGYTIPFIARYRKELHGSMDDESLRTLVERLEYLRKLDQRRQEVQSAIEELGLLTPQLSAALKAAATLSEVEDIYRPYKPKRRTRATIAREKGLEPLAAQLWKQGWACLPPHEAAAHFIDPAKGVETIEEALAGASDIIAEWLSDDAALRKKLRELYWRHGVLSSKAKAAQSADTVYRLYYNFHCALDRLQGYQVLAIDRGEREDVLRVSADVERMAAVEVIWDKMLKGRSPAENFLRAAGEDAWDRLIQPSLEREVRVALTEKAADRAIHMFAANLRPLLMQPPVKGRVTMGLDPGYRNGCKVAVVDPTGKVLDTAVVYPTFSETEKRKSMDALAGLIQTHGVTTIAIGNGTASRETEMMTAQLLKELGGGVSYMVVSEAGASVYSVSKLASEEFPQYDVNLRSAVSIARRLQDPLAELVKIDPKAIGVGQYQHDMPQTRLDQALGAVVEDCVNAVGADLNTASAPLLERVAGLTGLTARNIVAYRDQNGPFTSRRQLRKVPRLGPKAFEQCAGFLRLPGSKNVLDNTAVHPESYAAAKELLKRCGYTLKDVSARNLNELPQRLKEYGEEKAARELDIGLPTLRDVVKELMKPGRDPRDELPPPQLRTDVMDMKDLKPGMELTGTVRNVIDFGAFVDVGVHQDGLVHISQISDRYLTHPSEVLQVGDVVKVWVLNVDEEKKRIGLTMKGPV